MESEDGFACSSFEEPCPVVLSEPRGSGGKLQAFSCSRSQILGGLGLGALFCHGCRVRS